MSIMWGIFFLYLIYSAFVIVQKYWISCTWDIKYLFCFVGRVYFLYSVFSYRHLLIDFLITGLLYPLGFFFGVFHIVLFVSRSLKSCFFFIFIYWLSNVIRKWSTNTMKTQQHHRWENYAESGKLLFNYGN